MLPSPIRHSLYVVHAVAVATLVRSIVYDRWITVLVALLLIAGAAAAQRGKTWGVGLSLGAGLAFCAAWAIGIAPGWFCLVGLIGELPFALTWRALARFDATATAVGTALATLAGGLGAVAWAAGAGFLFRHVPILAPSMVATNQAVGVAVLIAAGAAVVLASRRSSHPESDGFGALTEARMRVASPAGSRDATAARAERRIDSDDDPDYREDDREVSATTRERQRASRVDLGTP
jgi:hypothetical protein